MAQRMVAKWLGYIFGSVGIFIGLLMLGVSLDMDLSLVQPIFVILICILLIIMGYHQKSYKQTRKELEAALAGKK